MVLPSQSLEASCVRGPYAPASPRCNPCGARVRTGPFPAPTGCLGKDSPMPTAFVLSGGASLGSIQVGMLEALYEREIRPDLIVGTSVGALNGAFIAERPQTVECARELGDVWR